MTQTEQVPNGREADQRWKSLGRERRLALVRGGEPRDREEAFIALGYARRIRSRAELLAFMGAIGAFVVYLATAFLAGADISSQTMILAAGTGVGVGVALEAAGRWQGRRLERKATDVLAK